MVELSNTVLRALFSVGFAAFLAGIILDVFVARKCADDQKTRWHAKTVSLMLKGIGLMVAAAAIKIVF